jgi:hypothetical protein
MSRSRTIQNGRTIVLAIIVAGAGLACATSTAGPVASDGPDAVTALRRTDSPSVQVVDVDGSIANARAAQRQHDWQAIRRFQAQIIERVGLPAISAARLNYQRAVADLAAATARGDSHSRAGFRAELQALCEPGGLVGAFESCDGGVIVWGG